MSLKKLKELTKKYDGRVTKLFSLGRDGLLSKNKINYVKMFGFNEDDVAQLLMLANDMEIYQFDYRGIKDDESLEFYGVIHAWYALNELKVPEAKKLFIDMIENIIEDELDDWVIDAFRYLIAPYRHDMYESLVKYIEEQSNTTWVRLEYIEVINDMIEAKEVELSEVNLFLEKLFKNCKNKIVNAGAISLCIDHNLIEHHELIKQCFADGNVYLDYVGDLEDIEIKMGLRAKRETQKEPTELQKKFAFLDDYKDLMLPARAEPKVGRNDPCPCGSGKKYKKCCMNK